jgi:hypothetical protein
MTYVNVVRPPVCEYCLEFILLGDDIRVFGEKFYHLNCWIEKDKQLVLPYPTYLDCWTQQTKEE